MNEQIRELAEQAGFEIELDDYGEIRVVSAYGSSLEKFTELIVKECGGFVYNYPQKYLTRNQAREISLAMEEHFGVEE